MEITNLEEELNSGRNEFIGETILSGNGIFINENSLMFIQNLLFQNCIFKGTHLEFENIHKPDFLLGFFDCTFEISLNIKNCNLERLGFRDCKSKKGIDISEGNYTNFYFRNTSLKTKKDNILLGDLHISNIKVEENISMDNLNIIGMLDFSENTLSSSNTKNRNKFSKSNFNKAYFRGNTFFSKSYFENIETECLFFYSCEFQKLKFNNSNFIINCTFDKCDFLGTAIFEECKNLDNSHLKFVACKFEKYSLFDNSKFNKFEILQSKFLEKASFENLETNYLKIHQVTFTETAYFDNIKINQLRNCDRKTIRTIKQQLQKTENRIDFNRFRAYELAAHYEELDWKWELGFIDKSILFVTKISTDFGNSWRKALRFTIVGGFLIYLFLYIIENRKFSIDILNWNNWERLLSGFFRFLLVTDFYNPLETDRIYLTNPLSWLILIFGKIVIAFGIYEMIQSFRKFKA